MIKKSYLILSIFFLSLFSGCSLTHLAGLRDVRETTLHSPTINSSVFVKNAMNQEEKNAFDCIQRTERNIVGSDECGERKCAIQNCLATKYYREIESKYYPNSGKESSEEDHWPEGLPKMGLAMSGGGLRSAAFNMGVLQGLNDDNVKTLNDIQVMSSVSGGSYTNLWFIANRLTSPNNGKPPTNYDMLSDDGEYQKNLVKKIPKFGELSKILENVSLGPGIKVLTFFDSVLLKGFGLDGLLPYGSSRNYGVTIDEIFMRTFNENVVQATPDLSELAVIVKDNQLPFPIINSTVFEVDHPAFNPETKELFNGVFEFTPIRIGSEGFGFTDRSRAINLIDVAAASGAATDSFSYNIFKETGMLLGVRYPFFISAPRVLDTGEQDHIYTVQSTLLQLHDIHITDGGFSDNLGAYSLVKRLCKNIIIVDAGHDPSLTFNDYFKLKVLLEKEMNLILNIPDIEDLTKLLWVGVARDIKGRVKEVDQIDFYKAQPSKFFRANMVEQNVFEGSIDNIPYLENGKILKLSIKVIYIKLSLDESLCLNGTYGNNVKDYYKKRKAEFQKKYPERGCVNVHNVLSEDCIFPQESTYRQDFKDDQFKAYKMLGKQIILKHLIKTRKEASKYGIHINKQIGSDEVNVMDL
ncbi:hypothetical protein FCL47_12980 [Desulfopila sp. IMCC35006]|uniref:hypothetical protein n=1 Tax=Desulfopila sp. IMCC35006 TaxID=2569542 RepID=UPI0010AC9681|nr:hypothetical protein [Desulfopila sp. IMCC35006]TKB25454.1 hypothetical protein FCL47_12980 [Desulfopila sp. IMCC35006]